MQTPNKKHSISIVNRENASLCGVEKVISSCDTLITLSTSVGTLSILGTNLKIVKFSVEEGTLNYEGVTNTIKYSANKAPLIKRIFK